MCLLYVLIFKIRDFFVNLKKLFTFGVLYYPAAVFAADVRPGDEINGQLIYDGDRQNVYGGTVSNTTIFFGGFQEVYDGSVTNTRIDNSGVQWVRGGTVTGTTINNGGRQDVMKSGTVTDTIINDGGSQSVNGGSATGTIINNGGTQNLSSGSVTDTIINNGGTQNVEGGSVTDTIIYNRGTQYVTGGSVTGTIINDGGDLYAHGGSVSNTVINGGLLDAAGLSTVIKNTVVNNDGHFEVLNGNITDTTINNGSQNIRGNTLVSGTVINNGGRLAVFDNSVATDTTVTHGGAVYVYSGTVNNVDVSGQDAGLYLEPARNNMKPVITGDITISDKGRIVLSYGADSSGADMTVSNDASLQLNNAGACTTNCLYTLNSLALSGGSVALYNTPPGASTGWNTLNLSSLSGNGDFYMHTEVASGKGDLLNITGNATGSFRLFVQDSGVSPTSDDSLLLVKTGGGGAVFTLGNKGGLVELGTWEYRLKENNSGSWLLSPDLRPAPQPDPLPQP
ncbi:autotransporter outer membrane beta-barrel domain-containing protein, partial [Salmonella enterica]|nr:autotransporter outer membrane beta-barrel domain-containing protein [Salmonella enterica]